MSKQVIEYVVLKGKAYTVEWYYNKNLKLYALEYYQALSASERREVLSLFELIANTGQIKNKTKFRNEGDQIYAFKNDQERFLFFFCHGKKIIITNGSGKRDKNYQTLKRKKPLSGTKII